MAAALGGFVPNRPALPRDADRPHEIRLINGPIHYDIFLPVDAVRRDMGWLAAQGVALDHPDAVWVVVGWGARDFYTTVGGYRDVTARAIWRGLTGDDSVMRVTLTGPVSPDWRSMALSDAQMQALLAAITDSFADGAGTAALSLAGFSEIDRFFPARGRFDLINTCNAWVGAMLRAAGLRFGIWTPTPYAVSIAHRRFARD